MPDRARNWIGAMLKRAAERGGLEIARHHPPARRLGRLLEERGISLVLDVGANRGQYAQQLRAHSYTASIISFEPSPEAFEVLAQRAAADPNWCARQLAASDREGTLALGASDNFSSVLAPNERLTRLFPEAVPKHTRLVRAARLDGPQVDVPTGRATMLKLDVQGYEREALAGAEGILAQVALVHTELSLVSLYEGQVLLAELVRRLDALDYELLWLDPILRDRRTGEHVQFDGLFVRR